MSALFLLYDNIRNAAQLFFTTENLNFAKNLFSFLYAVRISQLCRRIMLRACFVTHFIEVFHFLVKQLCFKTMRKIESGISVFILSKV